MASPDEPDLALIVAAAERAQLRLTWFLTLARTEERGPGWARALRESSDRVADSTTALQTVVGCELGSHR